MSSGGTQNGLRKTLGALKDSTTVNLAKINSEYKELDIAIVKATNHEERPAKERHIRAVLAAVSATRPRADVSYCIHALARRLSRTHNWAVALKSLVVIHRALREVDLSFQEELVNYSRSMGHMLNMAHFKDDSSPDAWDYSTWVRSYALFLEERLECFRVLKYDIEKDHARTKDLDTPHLLEQLPALQQLLYRVVGCQPQGAAARNVVIRVALSLVASESIKIYSAISDGNVNLVDKFFEMKSSDALKAMDIYRRAGLQAERLSDFNEMIRNIVDIGRGERFMKIEQPPASFLQAMEEYVREAPRTSAALKDLAAENKPKEILAIEAPAPDAEPAPEKEVRPPSPPLPNPEPEPQAVEPIKEETSAPDLLGLKEPSPAALELDEKNAMALAIVPVEHPNSAQPSLASGATGWELALVSAPTANEGSAATRKLAGGLDKLTLDSLYDDAIQRNNQTSNPWEQASMGNTFTPQSAPHMFYTSNTMAAPHPMQMAAISNQQHGFIYPQHPQMMMMNPHNPFGNPFSAPGQPHASAMPVHGYNPYPGFI